MTFTNRPICFNIVRSAEYKMHNAADGRIAVQIWTRPRRTVTCTSCVCWSFVRLADWAGDASASHTAHRTSGTELRISAGPFWPRRTSRDSPRRPRRERRRSAPHSSAPRAPRTPQLRRRGGSGCGRPLGTLRPRPAVHRGWFVRPRARQALKKAVSLGKHRSAARES